MSQREQVELEHLRRVQGTTLRHSDIGVLVPGMPETAALAYDAQGRLSTVTKTSGVTTMGYDTQGRLETVTGPTITRTLTYTDGVLTDVIVT